MDALREMFRPLPPNVPLVLLGACVAIAVVWFVWNRVHALAWLAKARNLVLALLLGTMAAAGVYRGFAKYTNDPPNMVGRAALSAPQGKVDDATLRRRGGTPPYHITEIDVSNGWRVAATREGRALSRPFEGVATNGDWRLCGAYDDSMRINPVGWTFPWKGGTMSGVTVLSWGEFTPSVMTNYFPASFPDKVSLVPECNWHLVPSNAVPYEGDAALMTNESLFWHGLTSSNSLVLTWQNAAYARDANSPTNFQAELFADGSFEYRYDDRTVTYSRVHPFDLDFDGLPNAIDPEPETPQGASAWNQSDAWAAVAFPGNAAEVASAGGYGAWVTQRASDPNRRLVGLNIALQGGRWPVCVEVGGVPVMADGNAELLYAIDCGAQVPFSLSDGELESVTLHGASNVIEPCTASSYPYERWAGDVVVHLDSPRTGWIRRTADVTLNDSGLTHLYPGGNVQLFSVVTNCHTDAYLGCVWHGGDGISFSNPQSLATTLTYASSSTVQWATNNAYLVTSYAGGYSLTNTVWFTVGVDQEPAPSFTMSCQEVFFLNDADIFDSSEFPTNRPERIRPVSLNLQAPYGTRGNVTMTAYGSASPVLFYIDNGVTNLITETTTLPMEVTDSFARTGTNIVYVSCPSVGMGTITATLELDGGAPHVTAAGFKCIEPLRQLVTTERTADGHRFVNPSWLVMGTNAVLKVGVNGDFAATNVDWHVVSGPGKIVNTNGWYATVVATGMGEDVTVEARFNGDEIQPRFVLPVVEERVLHVRAFTVTPPESLMAPSWDRGEIESWFQTANEIYSQVGVRFVLEEVRIGVGTDEDWVLGSTQRKTRADGSAYLELSDQAKRLLNEHPSNDCISF